MSGLRHPDPYTGPVTRGIDVSVYQTRVDWHVRAQLGDAFAYCRVSDGERLDETFADHMAGARNAGLRRGAYQFLRPTHSVAVQAHLLVDRVKMANWTLGYDLPPVLDVERGQSEGQTLAAMLEWLARVESDLQVRPLIYGGAFIAEHVPEAQLKAWALWTPWYNPSPCEVPRPFDSWTFWQTTDKALLPGLHGRHCDVDVFRGDEAQLTAFCANARRP